MPSSKLWHVLGSAALGVAITAACAQTDTSEHGGPTGDVESPRSETATVERVVDGDTIKLTDGRRVRLIGIDTPESVDPRRPVECLGREASAYAKQLLPPGTKVRLELDVEELDRYDRTLAYVYRLPDELFVNLDLAEQGFAEQLTVPPNVRHAEQLGAAVAAARSAGRGLWGDTCSDLSDDRGGPDG